MSLKMLSQHKSVTNFDGLKCIRNVIKHHKALFHVSTYVESKKSASSNVWLERQRRDVFVKQAGNENFRCRSAFKLLQIDEKFSILHPGQIVIDCGAAPGSWCQVAVEKVNATGKDDAQPKGKVIGLDLKHIVPIEGVTLVSKCDFTDASSHDKILRLLDGEKADIILSDMAPHATGVKAHNHDIIIQMCFSVLRFSLRTLKEGGTILCKLWQGHDQPKLERAMNTVFENVKVVKPDASRSDSAEIFLLGRGFIPPSKSNKAS